jgi:hypothetical protein
MKTAPKRHRIIDGVKTVYHVHQVLDAVANASQSKVRRFFEGIGEFAMMAIGLALVCGLFWLADLAIRALKHSCCSELRVPRRCAISSAP